jgi:hypothetical protein
MATANVETSACSLKGSLAAIDLAPMSNAQQVKDAFCTVNVVDHTVVANAQSESLDPFHAMMRVGVESRT